MPVVCSVLACRWRVICPPPIGVFFRDADNLNRRVLNTEQESNILRVAGATQRRNEVRGGSREDEPSTDLNIWKDLSRSK